MSNQLLNFTSLLRKYSAYPSLYLKCLKAWLMIWLTRSSWPGWYGNCNENNRHLNHLSIAAKKSLRFLSLCILPRQTFFHFPWLFKIRFQIYSKPFSWTLGSKAYCQSENRSFSDCSVRKLHFKLFRAFSHHK